MVADLDREYKGEIEVSENEDTFTDLGLNSPFEKDCND